ncbi:MAG: 16S rRNA (adenine(1518)-N(6)/adenine(1519)-N(6))-dimethyltransferase RsmA [Bacilli bacterium]|jgi:16S rRNA (adenine1518-N6/adenine1519-N6)-dimethyltransferase|nr:16S rRNA (adenine(1518)-N(6)/adenine(1519)-N(6))-dimethyltransferase RsmA [Bacilli bacterium]
MNNIASIKSTLDIMKKFNISPKKNYGQNFIIDANVISNIITKANLNKEVNVIEIGPGIGALSQYLALNANKVLCIEIDQRLKEVLDYSLNDFDNIIVIFKDFLKCDLLSLVNEYFNDDKDIVVVANLPYYITTPILIKLFELATSINLKKIVAMMQKEVGQRLNANINTKEYNSLTILTQYYTNTKLLMNISKNIFIPQPKVDSVVIEFVFKKNNYHINDEHLFFDILRNMFNQRRKTILNNLSNYINDKQLSSKILSDLAINVNLRPENLSLEDYLKLSNYIKEHGYDK